MENIYCNECTNPKTQCLCNVNSLKEEDVESIDSKHLMDLQAKVLQWYTDNGKDPKFAEFFGVESHREGKID